MNNKQSLNLSVLRAYASDPADIKLFVDVFIRQTSADIEKLALECTEGPNRNWLELCHKIKGAAAMAGADALYAFCTQGENLGAASQESREAQFALIREAFDDASQQFRALST